LTKDGTALETARRAGELALGKKARDVRILALKDLSSVCDYFVIASGDADVQVNAIAEAIEDGLRGDGLKPYHREGFGGGNWVLLDYVDVVVHVFYAPTREFYALEKLWGDAPIVSVDAQEESA
jgi:ribosome-associated protein